MLAATAAATEEEEAMPALQTDLARQALTVDELLIDRGYINSTLVDDVLMRRGKIVCKPWKSHNGQLFPKSAFRLNLRDRTITCPNDHVQPIAFGATLDLNPLVVLIVTIGAGSLFGMIGMVLAAPLTSAALHINSELVQAKAVEEAERAPPAGPAPDPAAAL